MRRSIILFFAIVCLLFITVKADSIQGTANNNGNNPSLLNKVILTRGKDKKQPPQILPVQSNSTQTAQKSVPVKDNQTSANKISDSSSDSQPCCGTDTKTGKNNVENESETIESRVFETEEVVVDDVPTIVEW
ncbi:unnamed protein product [Rotaria sp. Silwood1]|nr:unnamed protein product [Rotaria sp. Silwood1]